MQTVDRAEETETPKPLQTAEQNVGLGRVLANVFAALDRANIPYCVLHGYETYPQAIKSDVDFVVDAKVTPRRLCNLLHRESESIGARIVRCRGYHIVLALKDADGLPSLLTLDASLDCRVDDVVFYAGSEVLANRRRHRHFWVPSAAVEFGSYLTRSIAKGRLEDERTRRLSRIYDQDPAGCEQHVARWWTGRAADLIISAAKSGDWRDVRQHLDALRTELRKQAVRKSPLRFLASKVESFADRVRRVWRPDGLNVVFLGPDGAGKSAVIDAVGPLLAPAFARWTYGGFAPSPLQAVLRRPQGPTNQPHGLPPRSLPTSLIRAAYWLAYYMLGYVPMRLSLARSTLVLNHRGFVDILVDPKRYRYGGPSWLVRLIWRLIPKPDLIFLLDAPPEVLQTRKQEVSFEETAHQRGAYLSLMQEIKNGHVIDAAQPLDKVVRDVSDLILQRLSMRLA